MSAAAASSSGSASGAAFNPFAVVASFASTKLPDALEYRDLPLHQGFKAFAKMAIQKDDSAPSVVDITVAVSRESLSNALMTQTTIGPNNITINAPREIVIASVLDRFYPAAVNIKYGSGAVAQPPNIAHLPVVQWAVLSKLMALACIGSKAVNPTEVDHPDGYVATSRAFQTKRGGVPITFGSLHPQRFAGILPLDFFRDAASLICFLREVARTGSTLAESAELFSRQRWVNSAWNAQAALRVGMDWDIDAEVRTRGPGYRGIAEDLAVLEMALDQPLLVGELRTMASELAKQHRAMLLRDDGSTLFGLAKPSAEVTEYHRKTMPLTFNIMTYVAAAQQELARRQTPEWVSSYFARPGVKKLVPDLVFQMQGRARAAAMEKRYEDTGSAEDEMRDLVSRALATSRVGGLQASRY